jgi:hypothetical protein
MTRIISPIGIPKSHKRIGICHSFDEVKVSMVPHGAGPPAGLVPLRVAQDAAFGSSEHGRHCASEHRCRNPERSFCSCLPGIIRRLLGLRDCVVNTLLSLLLAEAGPCRNDFDGVGAIFSGDVSALV